MLPDLKVASFQHIAKYKQTYEAKLCTNLRGSLAEPATIIGPENWTTC